MEIEITFIDGTEARHHCDDVAFEQNGHSVVLRWYIRTKASLMQGNKVIGETPTKRLAQTIVYPMRDVRRVLMWEEDAVAQHEYLSAVAAEEMSQRKKEEEEP